MAAKLDWYRRHDSQRREIAEARWRLNRDQFNIDQVAKYMLETLENGGIPGDRLWPQVQSA